MINAKKKFRFSNISINRKMIGFTIVILTLVSILAVYGLIQINGLSNQIQEVHNQNWPLANDVKEIKIEVNSQIIDLHAYLLGETNAKGAFLGSELSVQNYFTNLSSILGSNSNLTSAKRNYAELINISTTSSTGLFDATDQYYTDSKTLSQSYNDFLTLHSAINSLIIQTELEAAPETGHHNTTVSDELLTFDSLLWETQNFVTQAFNEPDNNQIETLASSFAFNYNGANNSQSIVAEIQTINDLISGAGTSIGSISSSLFNQVQTLIINGNNTFNPWISYGSDPSTGIFAKKKEVNKFSLTKGATLNRVDTIDSSLVTILTSLETIANSRIDQIAASADVPTITMTFLSIFLALVTLSIGLLFARSISKPLKEIADISKNLSQGDLTSELNTDDRTDEIGILFHSFIEMTTFLKQIILNVKGLTKTLATSAEEMASSSEEVNASSEEISSISQQMSKGVQDQSIQIADSLTHSKELRVNFDSKLAEINTASTLIESISSQVNMLALNASIEAARAGEYGRGFSVVADNIRKLADDSKSSVNKVQLAIHDLRESLSKSIDNITRSIEKVSSVAEETASGAEETSAATEEQAATMEELTASAQELSSVATKLEDVIKQFQI